MIPVGDVEDGLVWSLAAFESRDHVRRIEVSHLVLDGGLHARSECDGTKRAIRGRLFLRIEVQASFFEK